MAVLHRLGLGLVTRKGPESGEVLEGTSLFKPHDASGHKSKPPRCVMVVDVGSSGYRLYVSSCTRSLVASTREIASSLKAFLDTPVGNRIAAGLILAMACFAAVLTGGIFVGQTIGEALSTLHIIAPVQMDPLR